VATKPYPTRPETGAQAPSPNGHKTPCSLGVAPPKNRVRLPELAVGLFVTVTFALGAVLWHLNSVDKVPALAIAEPVARGETITADRLRIAYVASDDAIAHLEESQGAQVIGRVAVVDLPAGTLVTSGLVADGVAIDEGEAVAGLALEPGQYPALGLAPGDRVNVIRSLDGSNGGGGESVVARGAAVFAVEDLANDRKLVSVTTEEGDADAVAAAAGGGTLRLVLVAP
jgi:hypothetical protein